MGLHAGYTQRLWHCLRGLFWTRQLLECKQRFPRESYHLHVLCIVCFGVIFSRLTAQIFHHSYCCGWLYANFLRSPPSPPPPPKQNRDRIQWRAYCSNSSPFLCQTVSHFFTLETVVRIISWIDNNNQRQLSWDTIPIISSSKVEFLL